MNVGGELRILQKFGFFTFVYFYFKNNKHNGIKLYNTSRKVFEFYRIFIFHDQKYQNLEIRNILEQLI